jgi:uroporphyrinogen-III decarboxylase
MNSMERVMAALQGAPVDRPPVLLVTGLFGAGFTGTPTRRLYSDPSAYVESQLAVLDRFPLDMALAPFDFSILAEAFGSSITFFDDQAPNLREPVFETTEAFSEDRLPTLEAGRLPYVLESTRRLQAAFAEEKPVMAAVPGPCSLPTLAFGLETWLDCLLFDAERATEILSAFVPFWTRWCQALLEAGATGLVIPEGFAASTVSSRDFFKQKVLPVIEEAFASVEGPLLLHHTGGPILHILDLVRNLPHLMGISISSKDSILASRDAVGAGVPLLGNMDALEIATLSPESAFAKATTCLRAGHHGQPHLLSSSGPDMPIDTPPEVIDAIIRAVHDYPQTVSASFKNTTCLCCGVLKAEVEHLRDEGHISSIPEFLPSSLHMNPQLLEQKLYAYIEEHPGNIDLIYGDCCPSMLQMQERAGVKRTDCLNCAQLILGRDRYRYWITRGAFLMLPEWAHNWRRILTRDLGIRPEELPELMRSQCNCIVYLDTGVSPVPTDELEDCARFCRLPLHIEQVSLDNLAKALSKV